MQREVVGITGDNSYQIFKLSLEELRQRFRLSPEEIIELIKISEPESSIPISVFNNKELSCLETIVCYMKENLNMRFTEIAKALNRDQRTIWGSYNRAKKKRKQALTVKEPGLRVPIQIFKNRKLSVLENITAYLKEEQNCTNKEIAKLLNRDPRTIWTVYDRVKKKRK